MPGTWSTITYRSSSAKGGANLSMFSAVAEFTADGSTGAVPDLELTRIDPALLADLGVVFDGTTPPDTLTITVKDIDGLTVATAADVTASGRTSLATKPSVIGGCTVSISGNTTAFAKAKVVLNFLSNLR